jgi:hypothetical protein
MSILDKGPGCFSVIDLPAATLLLVGVVTIRWLADAVRVRSHGDQVFHRMAYVRRGCVHAFQQETTGRDSLPITARRQSNPDVLTRTATSGRL